MLPIRVRCSGQEGREDPAEALPTPPPSRSGGQGSFWGLTPTLRGDRAPSRPPQARSWGGCVDEAMCAGEDTGLGSVPGAAVGPKQRPFRV